MGSDNGQTRRAVGAVVFDAAGRVLLIRRGKPPLEGSWSLPGGRVEAGEEAAAAVEREVLEETGLSVRADGLVAAVVVAEEGYSYAIDDYLCALRDARAAEPSAGDDAREARWVAVAELGALGVRPLAIDVILQAQEVAASRSRGGSSSRA